MDSSGGGKPVASSNRTWCKGEIYFTQAGCLFVANKSLAQAIDDVARAHGFKLCVSYESPGSPGNHTNLGCAC